MLGPQPSRYYCVTLPCAALHSSSSPSSRCCPSRRAETHPSLMSPFRETHSSSTIAISIHLPSTHYPCRVSTVSLYLGLLGPFSSKSPFHRVSALATSRSRSRTPRLFFQSRSSFSYIFDPSSLATLSNSIVPQIQRSQANPEARALSSGLRLLPRALSQQPRPDRKPPVAPSSRSGMSGWRPRTPRLSAQSPLH